MLEPGGAGEGNRTLVVSLEGFCSTIELHPPLGIALDQSKIITFQWINHCHLPSIIVWHFPNYGRRGPDASTVKNPSNPLFPINNFRCCVVEGEGFEPSKAEPSDLQSDPFDRSGTPPNETSNCEGFNPASQR